MRVLQCLVCILVIVGHDGAPTGCSYDSTEVLYTCSARSWALPLAYSQFNNGEPQRILLKDVTGTIGSGTFSGFTSINTGSFDSRYVPSLHIMCFAHSDVILSSAAFTDFSFIDEVKITDCGILSLPANVFSGFADVNLFHIIGGSITNMQADAFNGLNVKKMNQYASPLGEFGIINSQLSGSTMAAGALFSMAEMESLRLESAHMLVTQVDMFSALKKVKRITLNHNSFTKIQENVFSGLDALSHVEFHGISWYCTCGYLWFIDYAESNNITLSGDLVCTDPADVLSKLTYRYDLLKMYIYSLSDG